jgi:hypothetical protein
MIFTWICFVEKKQAASFSLQEIQLLTDVVVLVVVATAVDAAAAMVDATEVVVLV